MNGKWIRVWSAVATASLSWSGLSEGSGTGAAHAADLGDPITGSWSQWRGERRDASVASLEVPAAWPPELKLVWQSEVGASDSGPVVADGRVFTFTRDGDREVVTALDLEDGSVVWREGAEAPFQPMVMVGVHGAGPYSTPLVAGGRVFTLGITQHLSARDAATGKLLWKRTFDSEYDLTQPFYGNSLSPILAEGALVLEVGGGAEGALLAVDPETGKDVWRVPGDGPAYGSPIVAEIGGTKQIVTLTQRRLIGVEAASGRLLWEIPFQVDLDVTSLTPLHHGGVLFLSASRRPLRALRPFEKDGEWMVEELWSNDRVSCEYSSPVLAGGSLVAFATQNKGQLVVVDPTSGEITWAAEGRQGESAYLVAHESTVLAFFVEGDLQIATVENGRARMGPRYTVADSLVWSHPAVLDRHLLVKDRSHVRLWEIAAE